MSLCYCGRDVGLMVIPLPVPGGDGRDAAAAVAVAAARGLGAEGWRGRDIYRGAETPAPHVNWLLAPHFCGRDRSRSRRQCHRDGRGFSDTQTLTPM